MEYEFNAYFDISQGYDVETFRKEMEELYNTYPKVRLIMDLEKRDISMSSLNEFKKLKRIFDDDQLGVEKLIETIVLCKDGIKKSIVKHFIKLIPTKRPVHFY